MSCTTKTKLKAAVSYYGLRDGMKSPVKPQDPVDFAADLKVPVLGLHVRGGGFFTPTVIDQMRSGLVKSGSGSQIVVFPNVNHGFNADNRPTYDKTAAACAQKLASDMLREHSVRIWAHAFTSLQPITTITRHQK